ncbi:M6 family metalloprotease domain-containing protein [Clostridium sporogenes]|uniref:M6 family metalloprotease domain-containing protein n=1 Tax=Clostridium botulinum TaxID=1491 RepID=A0A6M0SYP0_CLOBO|nr:M6 family metalloprotease domain-containing protein [Clostridium sporogenes]NFA59692.1 M6 family metalloprotease domain-containing protein [Clostridium botulinum]NFI73177.1 M6 family metalloprotease domain-containing protein [Clostridium sporogenes]NFL73216.1 M6 family metalloprotease domain-containing protein [Clostridium sporogenes]NFM24736.1 M6 family metalloprotease domain-containing protein [Clostridium sporogenes]NFP60589.1 M6 family metalloprotease domain-containing protein [Clostrid
MKKNLLPKLVLPVLVASSTIIGANSTKVSAAPINDAEIKLTQPDGQVIQCYASGDEFYNYLHDSDGRAIVKDEKTGYYVYGKYVKSKVQPSRERVTKTNIENLKQIDSDARVNMKDVKAPKDEIQKQRKLLNADNPIQRTKNIGQLNNIVIFIKFSDQDEIRTNLSRYDNQFNSKSQASVNNYFKEISYDKLDINTTFYPKPNGNTILSYTDSHPRSYYTNVPQNERAAKEQTLLKNAVESVRNQIPSNLNVDSDNDGKVDNVCFIIKGATTEWSSLLWPHKWNMFYHDVRINGKRIDTYNFQLEDFINTQGVGVLSHEMFHTLGAPDLYHYNNDGKVAVGPWDVMDQTAPIPQSTGAYMKMYYGKWVDGIKEINKPGKYSISKIGSEANNSYIIKSPNSNQEYFVVEYRKKEGQYESNLPGEGLLVYRINTAYAGRGNASGDDEIYLYRPNGGLNVVGDLTRAALGYNKVSIDSKELFLSNGKDSGISLRNISTLGNTANFDVVINGQTGDGETGDEKLSLKYNVNFDDTKTLSKAEDISGECVYGKKINNIELYLNGYKYMDAERDRLNDPENKYKGYDLSKAAFKFSVDFSRLSEGNYPYEIKITTEDGQKISIKQGYLKVKKQTGDTEDKDIKEWKPGTSYKVGDIVTYNNYKYKCIQAHNAIVTWEPSKTPALWGRIY